MTEALSKQVLFTLAQAVKLTDRGDEEELLEELLRRRVSLHVQVPLPFTTFAHWSMPLDKTERAIQRLQAGYENRLDEIDAASSNTDLNAIHISTDTATGTLMNQVMPPGQFVRVPPDAVRKVLLLGKTSCSRFSECLIFAGDGEKRAVSPREMFKWDQVERPFWNQPQTFFVTAIPYEAEQGQHVEAELPITRADLWIAADSLPKAECISAFGNVTLGPWASKLLVDLNAASHRFFAHSPRMDKKRKQEIDDWFLDEWKSQPETLRENARLLIVPDDSLRKKNVDMKSVASAEAPAVPRNPYTSSRLALINDVAHTAAVAGCSSDRKQVLRMLADAGFKLKGHRERAASIIVSGMTP